MTRGVAVLAPALFAAAGLSACGSTTRVLDRTGLERSIAADLERQTAERPRVACPEGTRAQEGVRVRCTLRLEDGSRSAVLVTVLDGDGAVRVDLVRAGSAR